MKTDSESPKPVKKAAIQSDLHKIFLRLRIAIITPPHEYNGAQFNRASDRVVSSGKTAFSAPTYQCQHLWFGTVRQIVRCGNDRTNDWSAA